MRWSLVGPAMLSSQRVFQKISLPLRKARSTPSSRAASTLARWPADQYSSCPTERNASCSRISLPLRSESTPVK